MFIFSYTDLKRQPEKMLQTFISDNYLDADERRKYLILGYQLQAGLCINVEGVFSSNCGDVISTTVFSR